MQSIEASLPAPQLIGKLPAVGTTVFSTMSALAAEHGAVNLSQGFPDFACEPALTGQVSDAMRAGHNQYPMMTGVPALREAVAPLYGSARLAGMPNYYGWNGDLRRKYYALTMTRQAPVTIVIPEMFLRQSKPTGGSLTVTHLQRIVEPRAP